MYTFKQACQLLKLNEHTLRYYTNQNLVPHLKRDKNNRRLFTDQDLDWLRGVKYLRELGISISDIRKYQELCQKDGEEAIQERYHIILSYIEDAKKELETAQKRLIFLQKKADHEKQILSHQIIDEKNPYKKHY